MNSLTRHRTLGKLLMFAAVTILASASICASAAIATGPATTNAIRAEENRIADFYQAQQSYQERLKVGRERYNAKQENRARVVAAMVAELQSRRETIVIPHAGAAAVNPEQPPFEFRVSPALVLLAIGLVGSVYFLTRSKAAPQTRPVMDKALFARYKVE
jgi:hypothetical protein